MSRIQVSRSSRLGWPLFIVALLCGCGDDPPSRAWTVTMPSDASPAVTRVAETLGVYLAEMTGAPGAVTTRPGTANPSQDDARLMVHLAAGGLESGDDGFGIETTAKSTSTTLSLYADTDLGHQYAVYEVLRQLGVRFFHPEEEYVPRLSPEQVQWRARTPTALAKGSVYRPDFSLRTYTFHPIHPLEHQEAFSDPSHPIDEALRVNDWIIKNRGNHLRAVGRGAVEPDQRQARALELNAFGEMVGLRRPVGITLHQQQQGGGELTGEVTDPRAEIERIVTERLEGAPEASYFGIHFGPTELTVTPDQETVDWINWAGRAAQAARPDLPVLINNHATGAQTTEHFDDLGCPSGTNDVERSDYYDLAFHTDPGLGVQVHTVMFYPLEGPAPVYDQMSFAHKLCLMEKASALGRPLQYFPEGSYWLSFDNAVPVYLPLYIYARGRDMALISPLLATRGEGSLIGHKMFNSGHEWGYWQQDYAVGLWHWNADVPLEAVFREMADPFCDPEVFPASCGARDEAVAVLSEVVAHQADFFLTREDHRGLPGGLYFYFAGEDPADEIAESTGLGFRPLRPAFAEVASWSDDEVSHFRATDMAALSEAERLYGEWVRRLKAHRDAVPEAGHRWFDEIVDGLTINGLRAKHTRQLYEVALGSQGLLDAAETLTAVEAVIRRREGAYRYPLQQVNGGGLTPETAVANGTTYPYRVHTKTHLMTYWWYRQNQVDALVNAEPSAGTVVLSPVFGDSGAPVNVSWPAGIEGGALTLAEVSYPALTPNVSVPDGIWSVTTAGVVDGVDLAAAGAVVRGGEQRVSTFDGLTVVEPANPAVGAVLGPLLPRLAFALNLEQMKLAMAPGVAPADFAAVVTAPLIPDGAHLVAESFDFAFALGAGGVDAGVPISLLGVRVKTETATALGEAVEITAQLPLADIVQGMIQLAGFDEAGAWRTLGDFLGFDAADPPEGIPVELVVALTAP